MAVSETDDLERGVVDPVEAIADALKRGAAGPTYSATDTDGDDDDIVELLAELLPPDAEREARLVELILEHCVDSDTEHEVHPLSISTICPSSDDGRNAGNPRAPSTRSRSRWRRGLIGASVATTIATVAGVVATGGVGFHDREGDWGVTIMLAEHSPMADPYAKIAEPVGSRLAGPDRRPWVTSAWPTQAATQHLSVDESPSESNDQRVDLAPSPSPAESGNAPTLADRVPPRATANPAATSAQPTSATLEEEDTTQGGDGDAAVPTASPRASPSLLGLGPEQFAMAVPARQLAPRPRVVRSGTERSPDSGLQMECKGDVQSNTLIINLPGFAVRSWGWVEIPSSLARTCNYWIVGRWDTEEALDLRDDLRYWLQHYEHVVVAGYSMSGPLAVQALNLWGEQADAEAERVSLVLFAPAAEVAGRLRGFVPRKVKRWERAWDRHWMNGILTRADEDPAWRQLVEQRTYIVLASRDQVVDYDAYAGRTLEEVGDHVVIAPNTNHTKLRSAPAVQRVLSRLIRTAER